tara:strand:+ start:172 stop:633 length:462 start_codon:yes stop_codon:yes gene_type:complete
MATSTLIQVLDSGVSGSTSHRQEVETFLAGGTIAVGDWVSFDTSQAGADRVLYVIEAPGVATVGNAAAFGVSLDAVTAGQRVRVVTAGYCASASVAAATVAGSPLIGPIGTAGEAAIEAPSTGGSSGTTGKLCGIALEADTANLAAVWVIKSF